MNRNIDLISSAAFVLALAVIGFKWHYDGDNIMAIVTFAVLGGTCVNAGWLWATSELREKITKYELGLLERKKDG